MAIKSIMNLPKIVTIDDINELTSKRYIESEIFDFKGTEFSGLYKDMCAMANNVAGGQLVLGVDQNKTGFTKNGFKQSTEDLVNQQIGSNLYKVEPTPKMDTAIIHESDGQTFYVVLQILGENINKPYFVRDIWQCYMRVGNSSRPASRAIVLNLLSNFLERRNNVQRLRVVTNFVKESFRSAIEKIEYINTKSIIKIPPIDLRILKDTLISTEWFLSENGLMGGHIGPHSEFRGVYARLSDLELLNLYIEEFNSADEPKRTQIHNDLTERQYWHTESNPYKEMIAFWDGIATRCDEFLSKNVL